jgi:iron complex transport system ATP-binding protein
MSIATVAPIEAVCVAFGYSRPILEDFSLRLEPGVVTGMIGPNGSGKTTALRLLDGILRPRSGEILLDGGTRLSRLPRREIARRIAMVPQNGSAQHVQSVFEFAMQGRAPHLSLLGLESGRDDAVVRDALEITGMTSLAGSRVSEISGGEKQRLLLARALAQQAGILLVDELTANLDIRYQVDLMRLVRAMTRERSLATLVVSHEINLLAGFADRIVLLSGGRIHADGAPAAVLTQKNLEVLFGLGFRVRVAGDGRPEILPDLDSRETP